MIQYTYFCLIFFIIIKHDYILLSNILCYTQKLYTIIDSYMV